MTSAVSSSTATSATAQTANSASTSIAGDFNTFLTMLTTQLQNQDPTNAMDPTEMTNQLVAFAEVEQQINMNTNLTSLISLQQAQTLTTGANLIGHTVELSGSVMPLQNGEAVLKLPAAGTASSAQIQVLDANGSVLRTETVPLSRSESTWTWDGLSNAGKSLPDGAYSFNVTGLTSTGSTVALTATALGTATGIQRQNNSLNLMFGSMAASMDQIVSVD
jgi:flagellar basal-body rod modification protein FlgD